jgi:hypothetical protein
MLEYLLDWPVAQPRWSKWNDTVGVNDPYFFHWTGRVLTRSSTYQDFWYVTLPADILALCSEYSEVGVLCANGQECFISTKWQLREGGRVRDIRPYLES